MSKGRLEAFSDAVVAIIITIMVLELKTPHETGLAALRPLIPVLLTYALSFVFVAIFWNNHHNMLHAAERVTGGVLWANLHLLFWLSLFPFVTGWMDENHFAPVPVAAFGVVLLGSGIAYYILTRALLASHDPDSLLARGLGRDTKGKLSAVAYTVAIPLAFVHTAISLAIYVSVVLVWLVPDRRFESLLAERETNPDSGPRAERPS